MDSIDKFIARKHGKERTEYKIPQLKGILDVTYGCIVYQEQVMQICRELAGYSYARADIVRRAMSKKKTEAMIEERDAFITGCIARGVDRADAIEIFDEMLGFAKYAFNKSHATVYAVTSYRTAYLKAHYPAEYFAALLSSVLDNAKKLRTYIADAQRCGVSVLPPDINSSDADFSVDGGAIHFGLLAIKSVGRILADAIIRERRSGAYKSFDEFVSRLGGHDLNKRTLESLIKCGVFDSLGTPRSALLLCYEGILDAEQDKKRSNVSGQLDLFASITGGDSPSVGGYEYPRVEEFPLRELLLLEKESSGMYFSGHMIDNYSKMLSGLKTDRISDIIDDLSEEGTASEPQYKDKSAVNIGGIITAKKTKQTKNGATMAFISVEDRYGEIEVIVFAKQYSAFSDELFVDNAVYISGNVSWEEGEDPRILLSEVKALVSNEAFDDRGMTRQECHKSPLKESERLFIKVKSLSDERINIIYRMSMLNHGAVQVVLFDEGTRKYSALKGNFIDASDKVMVKLTEIFGDGNVILK